MNTKKSVGYNRLFIALNYCCLAGAILLLPVIRKTGWNIFLVVGLTLLFLAALYSFFRIHIQSGAWMFVHRSVRHLDERELQLVHQALRISYSLFSVICLLLLLLLRLARAYPRILFDARILLPGFIRNSCCQSGFPDCGDDLPGAHSARFGHSLERGVEVMIDVNDSGYVVGS